MRDQLIDFRPQSHENEDHQKLVCIKSQLLLVNSRDVLPEEVDLLNYISTGLRDAAHLIYGRLVIPHFSKVLNCQNVWLQR